MPIILWLTASKNKMKCIFYAKAIDIHINYRHILAPLDKGVP